MSIPLPKVNYRYVLKLLTENEFGAPGINHANVFAVFIFVKPYTYTAYNKLGVVDSV